MVSSNYLVAQAFLANIQRLFSEGKVSSEVSQIANIDNSTCKKIRDLNLFKRTQLSHKLDEQKALTLQADTAGIAELCENITEWGYLKNIQLDKAARRYFQVKGMSYEVELVTIYLEFVLASLFTVVSMEVKTKPSALLPDRLILALCRLPGYTKPLLGRCLILSELIEVKVNEKLFEEVVNNHI